MSTVRTEITLKNAGDVAEAKRGHITDAQVRTLTVDALAEFPDCHVCGGFSLHDFLDSIEPLL